MLEWARDMGISYTELLKTPSDVVGAYLEMRDIEAEYGPQGNHGIIEE